MFYYLFDESPLQPVLFHSKGQRSLLCV